MVTQSHARPVPLLLTRPAAQGAGFAVALRRRFGGQLRIIKTPLMAPRFLVPDLPDGPFEALILTSQTGAAAFSRLGRATLGLPGRVYCVGDRTAIAARAAGLAVIAVERDAANLIKHIKGNPPSGRLLHLRGQDVRGNIEDHLNLAGLETHSVVIYAQEAQHLIPTAHAVIRDAAPVLVPLFSPRTATLFAAEMVRLGGISPLFVAAMSGDITLEGTDVSAQIRIAATPTAHAMLDAVGLVLADIKHA